MMVAGCLAAIKWLNISNFSSGIKVCAYIRAASTHCSFMKTSSNWNIFRVTGNLCGEYTSHRCISSTKVSETEFWCFLWIFAWKYGWVNNRGAGDLRRHRAHYDVIVLFLSYVRSNFDWDSFSYNYHIVYSQSLRLVPINAVFWYVLNRQNPLYTYKIR